jgi:hypothetical protein
MSGMWRHATRVFFGFNLTSKTFSFEFFDINFTNGKAGKGFKTRKFARDLYARRTRTCCRT